MLKSFEVNFLFSEPLDVAPYQRVAPRQVAENLPAVYTPQLAVQLLCRSNNWLEACLFADHFNDLRTQLLLRAVTDRLLGLGLLRTHCSESLIAGLLENTPNFLDTPDAGPFSARGGRLGVQLDALLQVSVLFDHTLLEEFNNSVVEAVEHWFDGLPDEVDERIAVSFHKCQIIFMILTFPCSAAPPAHLPGPGPTGR